MVLERCGSSPNPNIRIYYQKTLDFGIKHGHASSCIAFHLWPAWLKLTSPGALVRSVGEQLLCQMYMMWHRIVSIVGIIGCVLASFDIVSTVCLGDEMENVPDFSEEDVSDGPLGLISSDEENPSDLEDWRAWQSDYVEQEDADYLERYLYFCSVCCHKREPHLDSHHVIVAKANGTSWVLPRGWMSPRSASSSGALP